MIVLGTRPALGAPTTELSGRWDRFLAMSSAPDPHRRAGIRLATIAGVPVYLGTTWLILAAVIIVLIGPQVNASRPDLGTAAAYGIGALYAVILLVAVLVHEAAHAVAARAFGFPVHRVVADVWGGHTALDVSKARPGASAIVAAVGPASNAVLCAIGFAVAAGMDSGVPRGLVHAFGYLNGMLALFNILPGLPLDGGQIVEALVWRVTGSRARGRMVAGYAGLGIAAIVLWWFIARPLAAGERLDLGYSGWGLLIAFFLFQGARSAIGWGKVTQRIEGVRVVDVLTPVVAVPQQTSIADLPTGLPPVVVDATGRPVGLIDAQALAAVPPEQARQTPVAAVTVPQPPAWVVDVDPDAPLTSAVGSFADIPSGILALYLDGRLLGVLTAARVNERLQSR